MSGLPTHQLASQIASTPVKARVMVVSLSSPFFFLRGNLGIVWIPQTQTGNLQRPPKMPNAKGNKDQPN